MGKSNNNPSRGFLLNALGVAKKLSGVGLELVSQTKTNQVYKQNEPVDASKTIDGVASHKRVFESSDNQPQQILRHYVPVISQQLLGRHYGTLNKMTNMVSPELSDKVSDYFFERLNQFTNQISSVDAVLDQAGIQDLEELTQDVDRSKRLSLALVEQNKWIASIQGALSGATGVVGASVDIPASIVLALKTIYQVGRSYGFELKEEEEQDIVQYIFRQINLGILAEKQTLLMGLRAISNMLKTHDIDQLQTLLGSTNDIELLRKMLLNPQGEAKYEWLKYIPKISVLSKLNPVIGASISATYSWQLVDDVNDKAQEVFSNARRYLIEHKDVSLSIIAAYENSLQMKGKKNVIEAQIKNENSSYQFEEKEKNENKIREKSENTEQNKQALNSVKLNHEDKSHSNDVLEVTEFKENKIKQVHKLDVESSEGRKNNKKSNKKNE